MTVPIGLNWVPSLIGNWVPGVRPLEPFPAFNFAVEIDGLLVGGFTSVQGLDSRLVTEEFREGGVNGFTHTLPTHAASSNLVLRHGLTAGSMLWNWHANAVRGAVQRRNGSVLLLDRRQFPVMWWNFSKGLPVRWTGPEFDAGTDQIGFESIEIAHDGLSAPLLGQAGALAQGILQMARI